MTSQPAVIAGNMACDGCGARAFINGRWIDGIDETTGWVDAAIWSTLTKQEQDYFFEAVTTMKAEQAGKAKQEEKERDAADYDKMMECKLDYEALDNARFMAVKDMPMEEDLQMEDAVES